MDFKDKLKLVMLAADQVLERIANGVPATVCRLGLKDDQNIYLRPLINNSAAGKTALAFFILELREALNGGILGLEADVSITSDVEGDQYAMVALK